MRSARGPMCCRAPGSRAFPSSASIPKAIDVAVYRIGDRSLIDTVLGYDFQRSLDRYQIERLADSAARRSGKASSASRKLLNTSHDRFPHRRGGRRPPARRLYHGGATRGGAHRRLRRSRHAMVHRLRSRPHGLFRRRRHPCLRAFARVRTSRSAEGRGRADLAQQRNAGDANDRRRRAGAFEPGLARGEGGMAPALLVASDGGWRLRLPQPRSAGLRSHRSRRRRPQGAGRARCLRLYRARRLSLRRDSARHDAVARRARASRSATCR